MRLPRRLAHGQPAELVEHLGELRTRVGLSLIALAAGTTVAFIGRHTVLDWLNAPLPDGKQPITLGVTEPFTTSLKISIFAGLAITLPFILWQLWSFLAPAFDKRSQGGRRAPGCLCDHSARGRGLIWILRRAALSGEVPDELRLVSLRHRGTGE